MQWECMGMQGCAGGCSGAKLAAAKADYIRPRQTIADQCRLSRLRQTMADQAHVISAILLASKMHFIKRSPSLV